MWSWALVEVNIFEALPIVSPWCLPFSRTLRVGGLDLRIFGDHNVVSFGLCLIFSKGAGQLKLGGQGQGPWAFAKPWSQLNRVLSRLGIESAKLGQGENFWWPSNCLCTGLAIRQGPFKFLSIFIFF